MRPLTRSMARQTGSPTIEPLYVLSPRPRARRVQSPVVECASSPPTSRFESPPVLSPAPAMRPPQSLTLSREEAEVHTPYQVINPGIAGGFINPFQVSAPRVWFRVHNQTLNLYTHVLASTLYLIFMASHWATMAIVLRLYCAAALICWALSAFWHATSFMSERWMCAGLALDYLGVVLLACASNIMVAILELQSVVLAVVAIIAGLLAATRVLWVHMRSDIRKAKFGPMNAAQSIGILAFWTLGGRGGKQLLAILSSYVLYAVGLLVHQTRWPEKWYPEFQVVYSHPIMHVLVSAGSAALAVGYWDMGTVPPPQVVSLLVQQ